MKEIIFVTGNKGKVATASRILGYYGIKVVQYELGFSEPNVNDFNGIAVEKAKYAAKILGKPLITEDSGLIIYSLNGFPGTNSHPVLDREGLESILKKVKGKDRSCEFRGALAYWEPGIKEPITFSDSYKGKVAEAQWNKEYEYRGWSPLDLIFIPEGFSEPLASIAVRKEFNKQVDKISHFKSFAEWLSKR